MCVCFDCSLLWNPVSLLGDKPLDSDLESTFSHHVMKLHCTKSVSMCDGMAKRNRNGERNEEGLLQNGHALKRHNEDSLTQKNQDYEHKAASDVKLSSVPANETKQDRSPSSYLYSVSNENSAKLTGQPSTGDVVVSEKLNAPSLPQDAGQVSSSFMNGKSSCFISPTDVTAPCQHTTQTRPGSSCCQETDPSAGNDSQLILSLAAVARSACSSSVEAGLSDDDSSMPCREVDCQELKVRCA
jgi:hypothetical protein